MFKTKIDKLVDILAVVLLIFVGVLISFWMAIVINYFINTPKTIPLDFLAIISIIFVLIFYIIIARIFMEYIKEDW